MHFTERLPKETNVFLFMQKESKKTTEDEYGTTLFNHWFTSKGIAEEMGIMLRYVKAQLKELRKEGLVERKCIPIEGCDGNCTNESNSYCVCGPTPPPIWRWVLVK